MPAQYQAPSNAAAAKLRQNPQVAYVLAQVKKSLHHGGEKPLTPDEESAIFDEVSKMLLSSPTMLEELRKMQSAAS